MKENYTGQQKCKMKTLTSLFYNIINSSSTKLWGSRRQRLFVLSVLFFVMFSV